MRCEQARDLLMGDRSESSDSPELDRHLSGCESCRELEKAMESTRQLAARWQDEPVPPWNRLPMPEKRPSPLITWAPLAACLVMALLVMSRAEITSDGNGWSLHFGGKATIDQALISQRQTELENHLNLALSDIRDATEQHARALAVRLDESDTRFRILLTEALEQNRLERNGELGQLVNQWQKQRVEDFRIMERGFRLLQQHQQRTSSNLYQLAGYIEEQD